MKPMKFFLQSLHVLHGKDGGYFHIKLKTLPEQGFRSGTKQFIQR